jgi:hypothetical protein
MKKFKLIISEVFTLKPVLEEQLNDKSKINIS